MDFSLNILLGMSISSAALILIIVLFRRIFRKKILGRTLAAIWLIPIIRLLVPFVRSFDVQICEAPFPNKDFELVIAEKIAEPIFPASFDIKIDIPRCLLYVWLFGAFFTGALFLFRHINLRRKFACSLPRKYDLNEVRNVFGIKREVFLRTSEFADSPFTYGIIKPVIIMPKTTDFDSKTQISNILYHELSHIKRVDVIFKSLLAVCASVHWFNPSVWIMLVLANRDIELACDETALCAGKISPEEYAMTLIGMEEQRCLDGKAGFAGGKLEERIVRIMASGKSEHCIAFDISVFVLSVIAALFTNVSVICITGISYSYNAEEITEAIYSSVSEEYSVWKSDEISDAGETVSEVYFIMYSDINAIDREKISADTVYSYDNRIVYFAEELACVHCGFDTYCKS